MNPLYYLFKAIIGGVVLLVISFPTLTDLDIERKRDVCAARREALVRSDVARPEHRACPFGNVPYLYVLAQDGTVRVQCVNGNGRVGLPRDRWIRIR